MPQLKGRDRAVWAIAFAAAAASVAAGAVVGGRSYVVVSAVVVLCAIVPCFVRFERRRPQAREVVMLAVLCALAVAARVAFVWLPHFKPMLGIIMIAGMAFGASPGFLVGSLSALVSNFIFGQGPWTPWQMLAYGVCGLVFGLLANGGFVRGRLGAGKLLAVSIAGGLFVVAVAGPILDTSSLFFMVSSITPESALAVYGAGFPVNLMHGAATTVTILLLANPLLGKLARVKGKYGMF